MKINAVIVCYRSWPRIVRLLPSLRCFLPESSRIVIVDNGGDERDRPPIGHLASAEIIASRTNLGFGRAVNCALARVLGDSDMVLLVNPDVDSIVGSCATAQKLFEVNPRAAAVGVRLTDTAGRVERSSWRFPRSRDLLAETLRLAERFPSARGLRSYRMLDWSRDSLMRVDALSGAFLFLRAAALRDVGGFDPDYFVYWEDTDWFRRAADRGWEALFTPDIEVVHAGRSSTDDPDVDPSVLMLEGALRYSYLHFSRVGYLGLRPALAACDAVRLLSAGLRAAVGSPDGRRQAQVLARRLLVHARGPSVANGAQSGPR